MVDEDRSDSNMACRLLLGILLATAFVSIFSLALWGKSGEKVLLKNVEAITLKEGEMTTGRRSSPMLQLKYKGGSASKYYAPNTVQCMNKGHDGYDIQWECVADLAQKVKFGEINVICEGYDYPNDPYILKGSCGLEYTLDIRAGYHHDVTSFWPVRWFKFVALLVIIVVICKTCIKCRNAHRTRNIDTVTSQQQRRWCTDSLPPPPYGSVAPSAPPSDDDPPPPYDWSEDTKDKTFHTAETGRGSLPGANNRSAFTHPDNRDSTCTATSAQPNQNNNSFWSGVSFGRFIEQIFGKRNNSWQNQSGWWSDWGRGWRANWNGGSSWFSSTSRTTSGFGGTSRR